jgi:DNA-binding transcriptional ArsR family regulator
MPLSKRDLDKMKAGASEASALLRALGNERRLLVLCHLMGSGEASAGELALAVELSPSALSQHLSRMREEGLVQSRRQAQVVLYRIADTRLERLIALLKDLYCP